MKIIKRIFKVIGLIILFFVLVNASDLFYSLNDYFYKSPKEYKDYINANRLDSLLINSSLNVKIFNSKYQEDLIRLNDSMSYFRVNKLSDGVETIMWYKINYKGHVIDSLSMLYKSEYAKDIDSYLVNIEKEYYLTWLYDGDTIKKPIKTLNDGKVIRDKDTIKKIFNNVKFTNINYSSALDSANSAEEIIFYKDSVFYKCFTTKKARVPLKSFYHFEDLIESSNIGKVIFYDRIPELNYILKNEKPDYWGGYAYIDVNILGETFKIKEYRSVDSKNDDISKMNGIDLCQSFDKKYFLLKQDYHNFHRYYLITK